MDNFFFLVNCVEILQDEQNIIFQMNINQNLYKSSLQGRHCIRYPVLLLNNKEVSDDFVSF